MSADAPRGSALLLVEDRPGNLLALESVLALLGRRMLRPRWGEEQLARKSADLERSNRNLEQFAYIASHDLQDPLRVVAGFVGLSRDRVAAGDEAKAIEWTDRVTAAVGMMSTRNVVANAVKFRRPGVPPSVEVASSTTGATVTVSVRDNGRGIAPGGAERAFQLFERLDGEPYPRTGLGLAFCRKLLERAGRRTWMEPNEGPGVTVRFTLPAVSA